MNANEPITGELRERIRQAEHIIPLSGDSEDTQVRINLAWLKEKLDAIDSIHAQLERENEDLRMKFVNTNRHAQHVERENESLKAELDRVLGEQDNGTTMPPLLDMDGKPIHFGDVMVMDGDSELREVFGFYEGGFIAWLNGKLVPCATGLYRHATTDTWERIIEDVLHRGHDDYQLNVDIEPYVARCKALCERTGEDA